MECNLGNSLKCVYWWIYQFYNTNGLPFIKNGFRGEQWYICVLNKYSITLSMSKMVHRHGVEQKISNEDVNVSLWSVWKERVGNGLRGEVS